MNIYLEKELLTISAALHASFARVRARVSDQAPQQHQLRELCVKVCIMVVGMAGEGEADRRAVVERVREVVECSMPEEEVAAVDEGEQDRKRVGVAVKESLGSVTREGQETKVR
jgi:hypothetical protein